MKAIHNVFGYINCKSIAIIFVVFSIVCFFNGSIPAFAQQQQGINWIEICRNPLVKAMISEWCEDLTTPDGYTLAPDGEHVLAGLGGGLWPYW